MDENVNIYRVILNFALTILLVIAVCYCYKLNPKIELNLATAIQDPKLIFSLVIAALWTHNGLPYKSLSQKTGITDAKDIA